jgi:hypothetical protein
MKNIINKIKKNKATQFDIQDLVEFFAKNLESLNVGEELMAKEYIRKGAEQTGIDPKDIQDVFNSFRKGVK